MGRAFVECREKGKLAILILFLVVGTGQIRGRKTPPGPVLRGTINVVLANDHGIVAITDSMVTVKIPDGQGGWVYRQLPQPGEKVFQVDDRTVCTIAGFGSAPTPTVPEFVNTASGIMQRFKERLGQQSGQLTVKDKLRMLEGIFSFYLGGVANLRDIMSSEGDYSFQLLIAGYDPDGTPEVGKLVLRMIPPNSTGSATFQTVVDELSVTAVGRNLTWRIAGIGNVAARILEAPNSVPEDTAIQVYANSVRAGQPLTIEQMKELGISLKEQTAHAYREVGGPNQIAVLYNGRVQSVERPDFPLVATTHIRFDIVPGSYFSGTGPRSIAALVYVPPPHLTLFFKNSISHATQPLDYGYFSGNRFEDCWLRYREGTLRFDSSNEVINSDLIIGPALDRSSPTVKHLVKDFKWRHVTFESK